MRPSGIEWLGEVPVGWSVVPLKSVANVVGRIGFRGYTTEDLVGAGEGAIALSPSNLREHQFDLSTCTYISWPKFYESPEIALRPGDIVFVKTGSSMGKVAFAHFDPDLSITINPQLAVLKAIRCDANFLLYSLTTSRVLAELRSRNSGGSIPTMTQQTIGNVAVPLPGANEQVSIVEFLDHATSKIDALITKARKMTAVLRERRQALISAAVTGKIHVRDL